MNASNNNEKIEQLNKKLLNLQEQIGRNSIYINSLKDSIESFQQLDISSESTDQDIINSLIRIQSKLNIIEDKIFYSDSLYFNLFNDLVLIESQIGDLNQNIDNIASLNVSIGGSKEETDNNIEPILNYSEAYDLAIEFYVNKEYKKSLEAFKVLVALNNKDNLADNSQFWIGQIYYTQKNYELAISEYQKVSILGDKNKAPDADYKIALCHVNLNQIDEAINQFQNIISKYPNEINLVSKSQKYIERYR